MAFSKLLQKPSDKILWLSFLCTFVLTILAVVAIFPIVMGDFPVNYDLTAMKNAWTQENMEIIFAKWMELDPALFEQMEFVHYVDFGFMILYGYAFFSGMVLMARGMKNNPKLQKIFLYGSILPILAVICDVIEGIYIFRLLASPNAVDGTNVYMASLAATVTLVFLGITLVLLIIGLIIILKNRPKKVATAS
jgi:hypothetical protein